MPTADDYGLFWNSSSQDRLYDAESFSTWLRKFFTTGVFQNDLQVTAGSGMAVSVGTGYCNIDGKVRFFTSATTLTISNANSSYPRIDAVVIERNDTDRAITLKVVTGSISGNNPVAPEPVRSGGVYQIVLAHVLVPAGSASVSAGNITDTRPDSALCGWITGTVEEIDLQQILAQSEAQFDDWFDEMKDQLSEDAAGNLQNQITTLNGRVNTLQTKIGTAVTFGSVDLNDYQTVGTTYFSASNTLENQPTGETVGWLVVIELAGGSVTKQLWFSATAGSDNNTFMRTRHGSEWTVWSKLTLFGVNGEIQNPKGGYVGYAGKTSALTSVSSGQALIQGQYHVNANTVGLPDTTVLKYGILNVYTGNGGQESNESNASAWIYQRFTDNKGRSYVRAREKNSSSWNPWLCMTPTWENITVTLSSLNWTISASGEAWSSDVTLTLHYSTILSVSVVNWQKLPVTVVPYISGSKIAFMCDGTAINNGFPSGASMTVRVVGIETHA